MGLPCCGQMNEQRRSVREKVNVSDGLGESLVCCANLQMFEYYLRFL